MKGIKFGVLFSAQRLGHAAHIEELGFDSLWVSEHILFHGPTLETIPVLGALAARTQRIRLGTAVYLLPLRHPTIAAKSFSTLDVISNGRIIMGIGVGGEFPKEFEATGVPVKERGRRTDEGIQVVRRLWTENNVSFQGRFYQFENVTMEPKPVQQPHPPIWVAGRSEAAMRRTGRLGDGYIPYLFSPERYRDGWAKVQAYAREAGRDPQAIEPAIYQFTCLANSLDEARPRAAAFLQRAYQQPFEQIVDRYCVMGTAQDCVRRLTDFAEAGVRHFILVPICPPDEFMQHVEVYAQDIIPKLQ